MTSNGPSRSAGAPSRGSPAKELMMPRLPPAGIGARRDVGLFPGQQMPNVPASPLDPAVVKSICRILSAPEGRNVGDVLKAVNEGLQSNGRTLRPAVDLLGY